MHQSTNAERENVSLDNAGAARGGQKRVWASAGIRGIKRVVIGMATCGASLATAAGVAWRGAANACYVYLRRGISRSSWRRRRCLKRRRR